MSSEQEKGCDEQREVWEAYRRAFLGEEKSPDEPMTWEAYRTAFNKAWPTFSKAVEATGTYADALLELYGGALEVGQIQELERIRDEADAIEKFPEEQRGFPLAMAIFEWLRNVNTTLDRMLREQIQAGIEAKRCHRVSLAVMIVIAFVGWAIAIITQWLGR